MIVHLPRQQSFNYNYATEMKSNNQTFDLIKESDKKQKLFAQNYF